jgi:hypothetical protein
VIPVSLSRDDFLEVEIYNLVGQKVATLYSGRALKGELEVSWDASTLASGIYFVRASTESEAASRKAVLIK